MWRPVAFACPPSFCYNILIIWLNLQFNWKVWPSTEKPWEARGNSAEQNPQQGKEHPAADKAGADEFELQCLESLVPDADEGDDEADADHAQTHVEDNIGAPAPLEFLRMRPGCDGSSFALFASGNLIGKV